MNKDKALKAGVWYSISNVLLRAVSIITAPIFTRLLSTTDYGKVSNFTSWQNILVIVCGLSLSYSIGRAKIDFENDFDEYISSIQGLSSIFSAVLLIIVLPISQYVADFMELDRGILISLLVYMIFFPSIDYMQSKLRYEYRYLENILIAVLSTFAILILSVLLILASNDGNRYVGRIYGMIIPLLAIALICYISLLKKGKKLVNKKYWKYALKFSIPMIPHALAMVVLGHIDRIMIVKFVGNSEAGIYSFGYSYAIILSVVTNAIMNAWQPWLYDSLKAEQYEEVMTSNRELNKFSFAIAIGFITIAPEVIMLLGSKDYWVSKWMVAPVAIGTLYQFYYSYFVNIEMYCKKTVIVAVGSVGAAIANFVLNLIFIPQYGYLAAAYTTMVGYLLLMIYHWIAYRIIFKKSIFAEKQILVLSVLIMGIGLLLLNFYSSAVVRYAIGIVVLGLYVVFNKDCLISMASMFNRR